MTRFGEFWPRWQFVFKLLVTLRVFKSLTSLGGVKLKYLLFGQLLQKLGYFWLKVFVTLRVIKSFSSLGGGGAWRGQQNKEGPLTMSSPSFDTEMSRINQMWTWWGRWVWLLDYIFDCLIAEKQDTAKSSFDWANTMIIFLLASSFWHRPTYWKGKSFSKRQFSYLTT